MRLVEFTWLDFQSKINGELVNNLGNLMNTVMSFCYNRFDKIIPMSCIEKYDDTEYTKEFMNIQLELFGKYKAHMDKLELKSALQIVLDISHNSNN